MKNMIKQKMAEVSKLDDDSGEPQRVEEGISVYLRIRPTKRPSKFYSVVEGKRMQWEIPLEEVPNSEFINNTRTKFAFKFDHVLPMDISQEQVFERVGKKVVSNALDGFNSTVFAYGQTGSGKTYTLTGGAERYEDRGIIPRALTMIFQEFRERSDMKWTAHVSYMEIYNEQGYDLLDPSHDTKNVTDLPRVKMLEDEHGNFHLKNLSMHRTNSEEEALNLLFLGDTNRAISETAMNQASSRSHCMFTVFFEGRRVGSDRVLRSKLNMVDLAGSERCHKTKSDGQTLREAQYINTSLFFLEMVIVALNEKSREHIPYRNSMMTTVLRDSLGGNCKTVMIATVSAEREQTDEAISTCRFAQRVALVKNDAMINEETDPLVTIARLKAEVSSLRAQIGFLQSKNGEDEALTNTERTELQSACDQYLSSPDANEELAVAPLTLNRIRECFTIFKQYFLEARKNASNGNSNSNAAQSCQTSDVEKMLKERDNEIAILVNIVRQAKAAGFNPGTNAGESKKNAAQILPTTQPSPKKMIQEPPSRALTQVGGVPIDISHDDRLRDDPRLAYSYFRERCSSNQALEDNKALLKEKYSQAKTLGERVNQSRQSIAYLKTSIEQLRRERAIEGLHETQLPDAVPSEEEAKKKTSN
uniref:Kinesin-like protein n=1 Tax=Aureoumbra lagunensis TaxID=44058 RepID=A0A7S3K768_9STRA